MKRARRAVRHRERTRVHIGRWMEQEHGGELVDPRAATVGALVRNRDQAELGGESLARCHNGDTLMRST